MEGAGGLAEGVSVPFTHSPHATGMVAQAPLHRHVGSHAGAGGVAPRAHAPPATHAHGGSQPPQLPPAAQSALGVTPGGASQGQLHVPQDQGVGALYGGNGRDGSRMQSPFAVKGLFSLGAPLQGVNAVGATTQPPTDRANMSSMGARGTAQLPLSVPSPITNPGPVSAAAVGGGGSSARAFSPPAGHNTSASSAACTLHGGATGGGPQHSEGCVSSSSKATAAAAAAASAGVDRQSGGLLGGVSAPKGPIMGLAATAGVVIAGSTEPWARMLLIKVCVFVWVWVWV